LSLEEPAEQAPSSVVKAKKHTAAALSHGIQAGQLILYYQPQIELGLNKLVALEALVRWQSEDHGLVLPDDFIPLAEESGLITELTQAVMTAACRDLADYKEALAGIAISINISSKNVVSLGFPEQLLALSNKFGIDPTQINLELTETAVMGELTSYLDILNRLRMKGFSLSIDDFGTGYSSLSKLYQAPFTELKIDRHFVIRMMHDNEAMAIVEICIMLGRMLGMKVVAEGAENQSILDQLTTMGCDIAQGYGIARPAPLADIIAWKNTLA
jgi:EAL domain-containing protein (putative c-di-GMP-specific phosphodiesterase class I)